MIGMLVKYIDKYFKQLFATYFFVLIVVMGAFAIVYNRSATIIEDIAVERNQSIVSQMRTRMDHSLGEVMVNSIVAAGNPRIREVTHLENPLDSGHSTLRVLEAMMTLRSFQTFNPILTEFFVVYENGIVIEPYVVSRLDTFYTNRVGFYSLSLSDWFENLLLDHSNRFVPVERIEPAIGLSQEIIQYIVPLSAFHGNRGAVVAFISNYAIYRMFHEMGAYEASSLFIVSGDGKLINTINAGEMQDVFDLPMRGQGNTSLVLNGYTYLVSYASSTFLGWTYVSIIRSDYVLAELMSFRRSFLLVSFLVISVVLVLSIVFSFLHTKPVKNIQNTIAGILPALQHSFFTDVLEGRHFETNEPMRDIKPLNINLQGNFFKVLTVQFMGEEASSDLQYLHNIARVSFYAETFANEQEHNGVKLHIISKTKSIIVLFEYFMADMQQLEETAQALAHGLIENCGDIDGMRIGVGNTYSKLLDVHMSFSEAMEAMEYFMVLGDERVVCRYNEIPSKNDFYFYPELEEQRLLNLVKNGDVDGVRAALNHITGVNFTERQLSGDMIVSLIHHLWRGIIEIDRLNLVINETIAKELSESYTAFYKLADLQKLQLCTKFYIDITKSLHEYKLQKHDIIMQEIKLYIQKNFCDIDLNLTELSSRYNLSEAYISQRFKEFTGKNFYDYLQELRISHAKKLLTDTDIHIQKISEKSGYSSYNTFAKAFKRIVGVSAGEYRKNIEHSKK